MAELIKDVDTKEEKKAGKGEKTVSYTIPLNLLTDDTHHTVIHKGKPYQIECGVEVEIPAYIAEILDNAITQKRAANALVRELVKG